MQKRITILLLLIASIVSGCGYRLLDARSALGPDVNEIRVEVFGNRSQEPGVERHLADAMREEFARRGQLVPREGTPRGAAWLEIDGSVLEVDVRPSAFSSVELAVEEELELVVELVVYRQPGSERLLMHERLSGSERFLSSADPQVYETNKERAVRRISAEIASRVHDELLQGF